MQALAIYVSSTSQHRNALGAGWVYRTALNILVHASPTVPDGVPREALRCPCA